VTKSYGGQKAVDDISFAIRRGESVGLVGESGSGKSTTAAIAAGLLRPDSGQCLFGGVELGHLDRQGAQSYRRAVQMVFQDYTSALNPRMRVGACIAEPIRNFERLERGAQALRVASLLRQVGLSSEVAAKYPRALSGGEQQRVCIARAIAAGPQFLLLDEVTSNLDVSVQAGILNLLAALRKSEGMGLLFISHDLAVVRYICDRVMIMREGRIVEELDTEDLDSAQHPYTRHLLDSVPTIRRPL